jgi:hypothetical protein
MNPTDAAHLGLQQGQPIQLDFHGSGNRSVSQMPVEIIATIDEAVPAGIVLAPRSFGLAVNAPSVVTITAVPAKAETV